MAKSACFPSLITLNVSQISWFTIFSKDVDFSNWSTVICIFLDLVDTVNWYVITYIMQNIIYTFYSRQTYNAVLLGEELKKNGLCLGFPLLLASPCPRKSKMSNSGWMTKFSLQLNTNSSHNNPMADCTDANLYIVPINLLFSELLIQYYLN